MKGASVKAVDKNIKLKIMIPAFISACWLIPHAVFSADNLAKPLLENAVVAVPAVFAAVILLSLIKNRVIGLIVLVLASAALAFSDYGANFAAAAALIAAYVYFNRQEEKAHRELLNAVLSAVSVALSIAGSLINFESTVNSKYLITDALPSFAVLEIFFVGLLLFAIKTCSFSGKKEKMLGICFFAACIPGVLCSFLSSNAALNNGVAFYPWIMLVAAMISANDKNLISASDIILEKVKGFLGE